MIMVESWTRKQKIQSRSYSDGNEASRPHISQLNATNGVGRRGRKRPLPVISLAGIEVCAPPEASFSPSSRKKLGPSDIQTEIQAFAPPEANLITSDQEKEAKSDTQVCSPLAVSFSLKNLTKNATNGIQGEQLNGSKRTFPATGTNAILPMIAEVNNPRPSKLSAEKRKAFENRRNDASSSTSQGKILAEERQLMKRLDISILCAEEAELMCQLDHILLRAEEKEVMLRLCRSIPNETNHPETDQQVDGLSERNDERNSTPTESYQPIISRLDEENLCDHERIIKSCKLSRLDLTLTRTLRNHEDSVVFTENEFEEKVIDPFLMNLASEKSLKVGISNWSLKRHVHNNSVYEFYAEGEEAMLPLLRTKIEDWENYRIKMKKLSFLLDDKESQVMDISVQPGKSLGISLPKIGLLSKDQLLSPTEGVWFEVVQRNGEIAKNLGEQACLRGSAILAIDRELCNCPSALKAMVKAKAKQHNPITLTLCLSKFADLTGVNTSGFNLRRRDGAHYDPEFFKDLAKNDQGHNTTPSVPGRYRRNTINWMEFPPTNFVFRRAMPCNGFALLEKEGDNLLQEILTDPQSVEVQVEFSNADPIGARLCFRPQIGAGWLHGIRQGGQLYRAVGKTVGAFGVAVLKFNDLPIKNKNEFNEAKARVTKDDAFSLTLLCFDGVDLSQFDRSRLVQHPRRRNGALYPMQLSPQDQSHLQAAQTITLSRDSFSEVNLGINDGAAKTNRNDSNQKCLGIEEKKKSRAFSGDRIDISSVPSTSSVIHASAPNQGTQPEASLDAETGLESVATGIVISSGEPTDNNIHDSKKSCINSCEQIRTNNVSAVSSGMHGHRSIPAEAPMNLGPKARNQESATLASILSANADDLKKQKENKTSEATIQRNDPANMQFSSKRETKDFLEQVLASPKSIELEIILSKKKPIGALLRFCEETKTGLLYNIHEGGQLFHAIGRKTAASGVALLEVNGTVVHGLEHFREEKVKACNDILRLKLLCLEDMDINMLDHSLLVESPRRRDGCSLDRSSQKFAQSEDTITHKKGSQLMNTDDEPSSANKFTNLKAKEFGLGTSDFGKTKGAEHAANKLPKDKSPHSSGAFDENEIDTNHIPSSYESLESIQDEVGKNPGLVNAVMSASLSSPKDNEGNGKRQQENFHKHITSISQRSTVKYHTTITKTNTFRKVFDLSRPLGAYFITDDSTGLIKTCRVQSIWYSGQVACERRIQKGTIVDAVVLRNRNQRIRSHRNLQNACEEAHETGSTIELIFKNIKGASQEFVDPRVFDDDWTFDGHWDGKAGDGWSGIMLKKQKTSTQGVAAIADKGPVALPSLLEKNSNACDVTQNLIDAARNGTCGDLIRVLQNVIADEKIEAVKSLQQCYNDVKQSLEFPGGNANLASLTAKKTVLNILINISYLLESTMALKHWASFELKLKSFSFVFATAPIDSAKMTGFIRLKVGQHLENLGELPPTKLVDTISLETVPSNELKVTNNSHIPTERRHLIVKLVDEGDGSNQSTLCSFEIPLEKISGLCPTYETSHTIKIPASNACPMIMSGDLQILAHRQKVGRDYVERKRQDLVKGFLRQVDNIMRFNDEHRASGEMQLNPNVRGKGGITLLHAAIHLGNKELVEQLIKLGAEASSEDQGGERSPLSSALDIRQRGREKLQKLESTNSDEAAIQAKRASLIIFDDIVKILEESATA